MELIGENLKNTRVKRKYTISQISKELRISQNVLHSIENDDFPKYLDVVFLIGHIRSYAKFLDLNEKLIIEDFKIQISYNINDKINEISKPIKNKDLSFFPQLIAFSSVIIISSSFYFLFIKPNSSFLDYAMTPDLPENLSYDLEEIEMNIAILNRLKKDENKKNIIEDENNILDYNQEDISIASSSAFASSSPDKLDDLLQQISLKFLDSTWIQLRDSKDNIIFSKLMNKGDEYAYNISQNLNLTAGNGGNIIISLNGIVKGKAGKAGEVIDSLYIDNKFNN